MESMDSESTNDCQTSSFNIFTEYENGVLVSTSLGTIDKKKCKSFKIRLEKPIYLDEFMTKIQYQDDYNLQSCVYEKRLEDDGVNLSLWGNFPEWKTHDDNWLIFDIYYKNENVKQKIKEIFGFKNNSYWFPNRPVLSKRGDYWINKKTIKNKYPIYIISKGRWEKKLTYDSIIQMNVDFKIVVEEDEKDKYIENGVNPDDILVFSQEQKQIHSKNGEYGGSIPVRNFIKYHSKINGFKKYWCLDDNIDGFYRFYKNSRIKIKTGVCFRVIEDYCDCFTNVKMSGMNYLSFCPEISKRRVLCQKNTRIYSCILLDNDDSMEWRGSYNEDTDLSLRVLKQKLPTLLFNCFLCDKQTTMSCKGGNTDSIYQNDGLQKKVDSLISQHPDVVKQTYKFQKVHHQVNYKPFKDNELIFGNMNHINPSNYDLVLVQEIKM